MSCYKLLIVFYSIFLLFSQSVYAREFHSHLVSDPETLKPGKLALENAPGASMSSSVIVSSLGIGLWNRFQLGTIPIFYTLKDHKYNYNIKYQFVRGEAFNVSLGYSRIQFQFPDNYDYQLNFISLSASLLKLSEYFKVGLTYNRASGYSKKSLIYTYKTEDEWAIDIEEKGWDKIVPTFSLNKTYQKGSSLLGTTYLGSGVSVAYAYEWWKLKTPSLGINYLIDPKEFQFLFKVDF
jgi:hypothetical protein